jgi:hypothetical protein
MLRSLTTVLALVSFLALGCVHAGSWKGRSAPSAFGEPPPSSEALPDSVTDQAALARELRIIRAKTEAAQAAAGIGGLGILAAGIIGYANAKDAEIRYRAPWIALGAGGAVALLALAAGSGDHEPPAPSSPSR